MARKTKRVHITGEGNRDAGKTFLLTEMSAMRAEKWAWRAFSALSNAGVNIPPNIVQLGVIGVVMMGIHALSEADFADMEPLMDDMLSCVQVCPDDSNPDVSRPIIESDFEEVATIIRVRKEVLELHAGFTFADGLSMLQQRASAMRDSSTT